MYYTNYIIIEHADERQVESALKELVDHVLICGERLGNRAPLGTRNKNAEAESRFKNFVVSYLQFGYFLINNFVNLLPSIIFVSLTKINYKIFEN